MPYRIRKGLTVLLLIGLYSFGLAGCTSAAQKADNIMSKTINLPVSHYLEISNRGLTPVTTNSAIVLDLKNKTTDCIVFPYNYGMQLLVNINKDWITLPNSIDNPDHSDITVAAVGSPITDTVAFVKPNYSTIPLSAYPIQLQIVVAGRLCKGGVPEQNVTADYIVITVNQP